MLNFKLPRKLKRLMQHHSFNMDKVGDEYKLEIIESLAQAKEYNKQSPSKHWKEDVSKYEDLLKIYRLGKDFGLTDVETEIRWAIVREDLETFGQSYSRSYEMSKMPKLPKQDNKGHYHGSGSGGSNRVRYPSTKRSKRVWRTFYEMFPRYAEIDGWDGEKSSRYNPKKK